VFGRNSLGGSLWMSHREGTDILARRRVLTLGQTKLGAKNKRKKKGIVGPLAGPPPYTGAGS